MSLKKNLFLQYKSQPNIYFFDESRFGTHSKRGHGWFKKGKRSVVKIKLGFKSFYVYTAVHANNGSEFSLILPKLNTHCMNVFLNKFSTQIKDKTSIIVMDGAAWHKSKDLIIPNNIKILLLPPYSPELNPVERLWWYIKNKLIKNRIYNSLEQLNNAVSEFIMQLTSDTIKSVCSANYLGQ